MPVHVTTVSYCDGTDLELHGDGGVLVRRLATFDDDVLADRVAMLLNVWGLEEPDVDPMEQDCKKLAEREYMTATAQSRADAEVL